MGKRRGARSPPRRRVGRAGKNDDREETGMKRRVTVVLAIVLGLSTLGMAIAFAVVGPPEVDRPNATMLLDQHQFQSVACVGEDGGAYTTLRGLWKGAETDFTPGSTD